MKFNMCIYIKVIMSSVIVFLSIQSTAYAYIDPGSGSVVMTAILGAIAAVGYTVRKYFYKIRRLFKRGDDSVTEE